MKTIFDYLYDFMKTRMGAVIMGFVVVLALALYIAIIYMEAKYGEDDTDG